MKRKNLSFSTSEDIEFVRSWIKDFKVVTPDSATIVIGPIGSGDAILVGEDEPYVTIEDDGAVHVLIPAGVVVSLGVASFNYKLVAYKGIETEVIQSGELDVTQGIGAGPGDVIPTGDPSRRLPPGGSAGQVLEKVSDDDYDFKWGDGILPPEGPTGLTYVHTQTTAASEWIVVHNLGYNPAGLRVQDSAGSWHRPWVEYIDINTLKLTFLGATDGKSYHS